METKYLYLLLNFFTIILPFIRSFDTRMPYYKSWRSLFIAFLATSVLFISWDVLFSYLEVWGFNSRYLIGVDLFYLPIEEWLFFVTIPYSCLFIYEVLNYYFPMTKFDRIPSWSWLVLSLCFVVLSVLNYHQLYTFFTCVVNALFAFYLFYFNPNWIGKYVRSFLVSLIGFLLVNSVLTGTGIEEEVVWYSPEHFSGIRIGTIPLEDFSYCFILLGINVLFFELFRCEKKNP